MRIPRAIAIVVTSVASIDCAAEHGPAGYVDALREIRRNERTTQGRVYARVLERELVPEFDRTIRKCSVRSPATLGARFLYRLDTSGVPVETIVHPDTSFSQCVREAIGGFELTPPPKPDYWIEIHVSPRDNGPSPAGQSPHSGRI